MLRWANICVRVHRHILHTRIIMSGESGSQDAKQCPWCARWCLKDSACDYVFSCGLDFRGKFHVGMGCGRTWCWRCGKKFCSQYHDPATGQRLAGAKDNHSATCCSAEEGFKQSEYCGGGCSSHCGARW